MPESVRDRPTKSHEYLFMLTKSASYFSDFDAIREPLATSSIQRINQPTFDEQTGGEKDYGAAGVNANRSARRALENFARYKRLPSGWNSQHEQSDLIGRYTNTDAPIAREFRDKTKETPHAGGRRQAPEPGEPNAFHPLRRNVRTVWTINPEPFPEAHFATFPPDLVKPCVLAGTSERGACPACGAPWERVVEKRGGTIGKSCHDHSDDLGQGQRLVDQDKSHGRKGAAPYRVIERGWSPTCACGRLESDNVPCRVLDLFVGSGTVCLVAQELGRVGIGVELKVEYLRMAKKRTAQGVLV